LVPMDHQRYLANLFSIPGIIYSPFTVATAAALARK
jgi:hypothetical protein